MWCNYFDIWTPIPISFFLLLLIVFSFMVYFYFPGLHFMHWIGCLRYEVCNYLFVLWTKVHNAFYIFPERLELIAVRWRTHSKISQGSKVKLFGLQIGRYTQHTSIKIQMSYLCHLVIRSVVIWVMNHFSLNWNVCISMLVKYFGGSKSIPQAKPKQVAWLMWQWNEYQWICPTPPIKANLGANIYRENRYDYVLDLPSQTWW